MNTMFKLEDFLPYYPIYNEKDEVYSEIGGNVLNSKTEFSMLSPTNGPKVSDDGYFTNQELIGRFLSPITPYKRLLVFHGIGSGKCHAYDTPILMYNGMVKPVQDVQVGDTLMGDDSMPRVVSTLARGIDNMYTIKQSWGVKYTVSSEHVLCLQCEPKIIGNVKYILNPITFQLQEWSEDWSQDTVYEITVVNFIKLNTTVQSMLKGYITSVDFPKQESKINPYMVSNYICNILQGCDDSNSSFDFKLLLYSSKQDREEFLNNILNKIGYHSDYTGFDYIIIEKYKSSLKFLIKNIIFLIRSLGYLCKYIKSRELIIINKNSNLMDITINWDRHDKYYGFTCDGNHRYLLGDCTVTHNSCLMACVTEIAKSQLPTSQFKSLILVKNDSLKEEIYSQLLNTCPTRNTYSRETIEEGKKIIKTTYRIETFNDFNKELREKLSNINNIEVIESLQEEFKNKYIFIDEAHNLYPEKKNPERYNNISKLFMLLQDTKIALLSATPMRNFIKEIAYLMNLVVPMNKRLDPRYLEDVIINMDPVKINKLKQEYFAGHVSYFRTLTSARIEDVGVISPENGIHFTNLVCVNMGKIQNTAYKEFWTQEKGSVENDNMIETLLTDEKALSGLAPKSALSACAVFPDGKIKDEASQWITYKEKELLPEVTEKFEKWLSRGYITGGHHILYKVYIQNLELISSKYSYIIRTITNSKLEKHYVYSTSMNDVGLKFLCALLKLFSFTEFTLSGVKKLEEITGNTLEEKQKSFEQIYGITKGQRFILISGDSNVSDEKLTSIIKIFNHEVNMYGEYISVIMGGKKIQEGYSFFEIKNIFIAIPEWNISILDQAIGRGIRTGSHDRLPIDQRVVKIHRIWSKPIDLMYSIDIKRYNYSENKNIKIKRIERIIKESSIDCELYKSRNIQPTDKPYSVQCDYLEHCNYQCVFNTPLKEDYNDTYNLYYSGKSEHELLEGIKYLYKLKSAYVFDEMYNMLKSTIKKPINNIILAQTLYNIISNNIIIHNKYGFINYLREESNMYFLVDDLKGGTQYELSYYAKNPHPTTILTNISQSIEEWLYTKTHKYITWFFEASDPLLYINTGDHTFKMIFYNMIKGAIGDPKTKDKMLEYFAHHRDIEKEYINIDNMLKTTTDISEDIGTLVSPEEINHNSLIWGFRGKLETKDGKMKIKIRDTSIIGFKKSDNEINSSTIRDGIVCGTGEFNFKGLCKTVLQLFIVAVITYQELPMIEYIMDNFILLDENPKDIIFNTLSSLGSVDILKKELLIHNMKDISLIALKGVASELTDATDIEPERNSTIRNIIRYTDKQNNTVLSALRVLRVNQLEYINKKLKIINIDDEIKNWFNMLTPEQIIYLRYIPSIIDTERIKGQKEMSGGLCDEIKEWFIETNLII